MKNLLNNLDIAFLTIIEFIVAISITIIFDKFIIHENHKNDNKKTTFRLIIESCLYIAILWIVIYNVIDYIKKIPFPFEGVYNYSRKSNIHVRSINIIPVFIMVFCDSLNYKLNIIRERI